MTPTILQFKLCEEVKKIFEHDRFKKCGGGTTNLQVFKQNLPIQVADQEDEVLPYVIIRVMEGAHKDGNEAHDVRMLMILGYYDDSTENQGHIGVLGMIQRIYERFEKEPMLANMFMFKDPFDWALQEEESYPYYFGAISITFKTAAIRKEDKYA